MQFQKAVKLQKKHSHLKDLRELRSLQLMLMLQEKMNHQTEAMEEVSQDIMVRKVITGRMQMQNIASREIQDLQAIPEVLTEGKRHSMETAAQLLMEAESREEKDLCVRTEASITTEMTVVTGRIGENADLPEDREMHHMAEAALRHRIRGSKGVTQDQIVILKIRTATADLMLKEKIRSVRITVVTKEADVLI